MMFACAAIIQSVPKKATSAATTSNIPTRRDCTADGVSANAITRPPTSSPTPAKLRNRPMPSTNDSELVSDPPSKSPSRTPGVTAEGTPTEKVNEPRTRCESADTACQATT